MFLFDTFQIAVKREPAVEKEMSKLDTDKKMSKKEKEERVLWKKNEVSSQSKIGSKMKSWHWKAWKCFKSKYFTHLTKFVMCYDSKLQRSCIIWSLLMLSFEKCNQIDLKLPRLAFSWITVLEMSYIFIIWVMPSDYIYLRLNRIKWLPLWCIINY